MSQVVNSFKEQYTRNRQKGGRAYGCSEVKVFKPNQTGKLELVQVVKDPRYTLEEQGTAQALKAERRAKAEPSRLRPTTSGVPNSMAGCIPCPRTALERRTRYQKP